MKVDFGPLERTSKREVRVSLSFRAVSVPVVVALRRLF